MDNEKINVDEGYFFGLGAFETIAVEDGRPQFLSRHLRRLRRALVFLEIPLKQIPGEEEILEKCRALGRGHWGLKLAVSEKNVVMFVRQNPYTDERKRVGACLAYSAVRRNETSPLTGHKTFNCGDAMLERRRARSLGVDELIFCNSRGELCEGTVSNLFLVRRGEVLTPKADCGLLPGIIREVLLENCGAREAVLSPGDAAEAEECFLTNSLMGILPVRCLGRTMYSSRRVTEELQQRLAGCRE